jgi:hypothetical protein
MVGELSAASVEICGAAASEGCAESDDNRFGRRFGRVTSERSEDFDDALRSWFGYRAARAGSLPGREGDGTGSRLGGDSTTGCEIGAGEATGDCSGSTAGDDGDNATTGIGAAADSVAGGELMGPSAGGDEDVESSAKGDGSGWDASNGAD